MTEQEIQEKEKELEQREARIAAKEKVTQKAYEQVKQKYKEVQVLQTEWQQRHKELDEDTKDRYALRNTILEVIADNTWKLHPWYQGGHSLMDIVRRMRKDGIKELMLYTPFQHTVYYVQLNEREVWYTGWWHIKSTKFTKPTRTQGKNTFDAGEWRHTYFAITPEIANALHEQECIKPMQIHDRFVCICNFIGTEYYSSSLT